MPGILDSMTSTLDPELLEKISHAMGLDSALVNRGFAAAGAVVLGGLTRACATEQGAAALQRQLLRIGAGDLPARNGISVLQPESAGSQQVPMDPADTVFGAGATAIAATLTQHLGFNVRPLLSMVAPFVLELTGHIVRTKRLGAHELADLLRTENDAFMKHPANRRTAGIVFTALAAADKAQALRQMFDEAEWLKVQSGPLAALYCISSASPCGAMGLAKEFTAATDAVAAAARAAPAVSLLGTVFGEGLSQESFTQLTQRHPQIASLLSELHDSIGIVTRKSPSDAEAYREIVLFAAQRAAEAGKEGGFLGIGGTRVSVAEQRAIDEIRSALW